MLLDGGVFAVAGLRVMQVHVSEMENMLDRIDLAYDYCRDKLANPVRQRSSRRQD